MKLRNLLAGAFVVGLGVAAGPAAAQPETAESVDLERLQAPAQTLEAADIRFLPRCDVPPRPLVRIDSFKPGSFGRFTPCWNPGVERPPLWG